MLNLNPGVYFLTVVSPICQLPRFLTGNLTTNEHGWKASDKWTWNSPFTVGLRA